MKKIWTGKDTLRARSNFDQHRITVLIALFGLLLMLFFDGIPPLKLFGLAILVGITCVCLDVLSARLRLHWLNYLTYLLITISYPLFHSYLHLDYDFFIHYFCAIILCFSIPYWLLRAQLLRWSRLRWEDLTQSEQKQVKETMVTQEQLKAQ